MRAHGGEADASRARPRASPPHAPPRRRYVAERLRHRGIGSALLGRLVRLGRERGCAVMRWQCLDWNAKSLGFYTDRVGATVLGAEMRRICVPVGS